MKRHDKDYFMGKLDAIQDMREKFFTNFKNLFDKSDENTQLEYSERVLCLIMEYVQEVKEEMKR